MLKDGRYILKRIIIGVGISIILMYLTGCNVKAETYVQPDVGLQINNNTNYIYSVAPDSYGSAYNIKVAVSERTPAYFILDMCTQQNYNDIEIINSSCNNNCLTSGKVTTYNVGDSCTVYGYSGWHVLAQVRVSKYDIDPVTTYYQAISRIRFGGFAYNTAVQIMDFYASDTDMITQLANGQQNYNDIKNAINNTANSVNNTINNSTTVINNAIINVNNTMNAMSNLLGGKQDQTNQKLDDLNNSLNDDNVDAQDSQINALVGDNNFKDKTGLSSIITAPLSILSNLSSTCSPIDLTIPYMDVDVSLPCMSTSVYSKFDSGFITTISAVINGFLVYRIVVALYAMVKSFKDPENDKIEVVDL